MILAEAGLFNYTQLRTPYYYKGHCDVGSGTGNLNYTSSTSCFTKIDQMNFNPDLIVAENPNISYYDFNRLMMMMIITWIMEGAPHLMQTIMTLWQVGMMVLVIGMIIMEAVVAHLTNLVIGNGVIHHIQMMDNQILFIS